MRIGIISDIHGNRVGLDAALADLDTESVDQIVCLGDVAQGGPEPHAVLDRLRDLGCPVVAGNADAFVTDANVQGTEAITPEQLEVRDWTLLQLTPEDLTFLNQFQPTVTVTLDDGAHLLCFHGSPKSFDDIILPETPDEECMSFLDSPLPRLLTGGHTHLQQIRRFQDSIFFNPGSVGVAYDRKQSATSSAHMDSWAEYAIVTSTGDRFGIEFRRVPYPADLVIDSIRASGRPGSATAAQQYVTD